ncbi:MAG: class I SAM-dependent methyltransferase [Polynucleobacter sp.]|uniref:class I SAM-dependent methyltransferase n=1 Tax=Polynucleobacter sp. TaxID=2029855 RepID=UPI0027213C86|nr:class I SAM-dependent methyltransferase [Polynucleobacter sp.]MDO8713794.1 class I SAM-dependent methyltransferase [Polynucleobacter sp.]
MKCYLCSCDDWDTRKGSVRGGGVHLKVLECRNCHLVTLNSLEHIGQSHYENSGMHTGGLPTMESWLKSTEQDDLRRFEMLKAAMTGKRLLDFGCGAAGFLQKAQSSASEVVGLELEKRVREYWGEQIRIYDNLDAVGECYDLITAFHVVEHLADPRAILQALASRLAKGGRLVVEVPSSEDALLTLFDNEPFQNFTYWSQHLYLFNTATLGQLVSSAGLKLVALQQYQRYPLSNHLYWLSRGRPGGHQQWAFLDSPVLKDAYANALASIGKCDTLIAYLEQSD